jgi:mercuric ion transport protein
MKFTGVAATLSALIASACCIGPALLAFAGVGSIGAFAMLAAYRPYLIGLTAVLLGIGFYLAYRKREVSCADGTCTTAPNSQRNKIAIWLSALVAVSALAFPYISRSERIAKYSPSLHERTVSRSAEATLRIDGMDCDACANGLAAALSGRAGVRHVSVDAKLGTASLEYDPSVADPHLLITYVKDAGFTAQPVEEGK